MENYHCRFADVTVPTNGDNASCSCGCCTSNELVRGEDSAGAQIRFIRLNLHYLLLAVINLALPRTLAILSIAVRKLNSYVMKQPLSIRRLYTVSRVNWEFSGSYIFRLCSYKSATNSGFVFGTKF